ncbi:MAG: DUF2249 domain-containing protein [Emcibacter sp.]|nr:DUF2249 domain-containing protein [Emcibacter sp.]
MAEKPKIKQAAMPDWLCGAQPGQTIDLDVRPILAAGNDPLAEILSQVKEMSPETILSIEAPFDPVPLRRLLAGKGYDNYAIQRSDQHWQIYFKRHVGQKLPDFPSFPDLPDFPVAWRDGILEMDLRKLMPPDPMIAVLKMIEVTSDYGGEGGAFTVWLNRDPIYLYPELIGRQWHAQIIHDEDDGLLVKIAKDEPI